MFWNFGGKVWGQILGGIELCGLRVQDFGVKSFGFCGVGLREFSVWLFSEKHNANLSSASARFGLKRHAQMLPVTDLEKIRGKFCNWPEYRNAITRPHDSQP